MRFSVEQQILLQCCEEKAHNILWPVWLCKQLHCFFGSTSGPQRADNDGAIISDAHLVRLANYNRTLTAPCAIWPARFSNHFAAHGIWGADCDAPILKNKTRSEMAHPVKVPHHCADVQHLLVWASSLRASKSTFYARLMSENELRTFLLVL